MLELKVANHPDKTKLIVYGSQQMILKLQDFHLTLLGKELLPVDSVKDLGEVFDSKLSFNDHTIKRVSSCMSALGQKSRVKHVFRKDILVTIINSLMFSKLYYCSSVWSNTSACNILEFCCSHSFRDNEVRSCNSSPEKPDMVTS